MFKWFWTIFLLGVPDVMQNREYKNIWPCQVSISNSLCRGTVKFTMFKEIFGRAIELSSKYFTQIHCLFVPLRKTYLRRKIYCVFEAKIIRRLHRLDINLFSWKVDFLSFKKTPYTNRYVEYSRTYDFSSILSSLIRQLNFTQNDLCATSDKNTNFNISKNMLWKVGISNSLYSRTVEFIIFKLIFAYAIELSSSYFW